MTETAPHFLELRDVSKNYGGVVALDRVTFACNRGTIHAILGENGAGKSTLIKIVAGVVQPTQGQMVLEGKPATFSHPIDANAAGVVCVFQELSLLPTLSVAENIGRDRQGAGEEPAPADPGRGHVGPDQRRRREGEAHPGQAAR